VTRVVTPGGVSALSHATVMPRETLAALAPKSGGVYADATLGRGGHAEAILEQSGPDGVLYAIDRDEAAIAGSRARLERFGARVHYVHGRFGEISPLLHAHDAPLLDGLVADLGVSSPQLDDEARGFSFRHEGPLDMRMDTSSGRTARELIAELSERELADVIYTYGDERKSRSIARSIKAAEERGELSTTTDLRRAVVRVTGDPHRGIDPATRTFQALRIAVNEELAELDALLTALPDVLKDGGVAVIISFHSLEDRAVKHALRGSTSMRPLTKRPLTPQDDEAETNPRSRSAKLRTARRVPRAEAQARA
jgi:16S rRNA (cytosine1402-N4)-methyltransferase